MVCGVNQRRSQDISKGGHTVSNIIVMAFSPRNIVGCFLKKRLTKEGRSRAPLEPPSLRPWCQWSPFSWPQSPSLCGRRRQGTGEERRKNRLDNSGGSKTGFEKTAEIEPREKMELGKGRGDWGLRLPLSLQPPYSTGRVISPPPRLLFCDEINLFQARNWW